MFQIGGGPKPPAPDKPAKTPKKTPAFVAVTVHLEPHQRDKLALLGGDAWLRDVIDAADAGSVFDPQA